MYYEVYIDVLFAVNFMMDYLLLLLVKKMLKCSATHGRICFGAIVGAGLTCVVMLLPITVTYIKVLLFHGVVNTCMIYAGLRIRTLASFVKAMILLYIGSFLIGGMMEIFRPYVTIGSFFVLFAVGGYYMALRIWNFILAMCRCEQFQCDVDLYYEGKTCKVHALIDSGNHLRDSYTDRPVNIIDKAVISNLKSEEESEELRYIPYCSVGNPYGVIPVFQIDRMCVHKEQECWIEKPVLGISTEALSEHGTYEMILNINLF